MAEETTETKITSIEDAVESIVAPSEEPTEEVLEAQETEEATEEVEATAEPETEEAEPLTPIVLPLAAAPPSPTVTVNTAPELMVCVDVL